MTLDDIRKNNLIIYECISGSKSQGLDTEDSDTDIRGVFILPEDNFFGFDYIPQLANDTNDIVFYELKRFVELLVKNNPNVLELLYIDDRFVVSKHPLFQLLRPELFLSKLCKDTFAGYAMAQIKRARGLNKKILNPVPEEKKSILDFCFIIKGQKSIPALKWLAERNYKQELCGLAAIPHVSNGYALFYDEKARLGYQGMIKKESSDLLSVSSIPKGETSLGTLYCNIDGYSSYCKDYKEYWEWVAKRNDARYKNTIAHGKNYDAKNLMHTLRLLDMAEEILKDNKISVMRSNRDELLKIKAGEYTYDYLMSEADKKIERINELYESSSLQEKPDKEAIENLLIRVRKEFYS